jgi:hypothetical protein
MTVVFRKAPTAAQRRAIEAAIPAPLALAGWAKRTLHVATDDYALTGVDDVRPFNAAIERWLRACHDIAPIDFALRPEDHEGGGTALSQWHRDSMRGALALVTNLAKRYDDTTTRAGIKATLLQMMRDAGIAIPQKLDPTPAWRRALDAGDAKAFRASKYHQDMQAALDLANPMHRRALIAGKPTLAKHANLDVQTFEAALLDDSADGRYVIDRFVERATKQPFWSTTCASHAAEHVERAPKTALGVLDRLVELGNAHPIVVENALWAAQKLGWKVAAKRLARYWQLAIAKLPEHPELQPYLVELGRVLGREPPDRPPPPPRRAR